MGRFKPLAQLRSNRDVSAPVAAAALTNGLGLPITRATQDNTRVGSFFARILFNFTNANTDTTITHKLGRVPTIYIPAGASASGYLYDGSLARADWTASQIVLRASAIGHYSVLIA